MGVFQCAAKVMERRRIQHCALGSSSAERERERGMVETNVNTNRKPIDVNDVPAVRES